MNRTPDLREVIAAHVSAALEGLRVAMPGRVEAYDAAKRLADVVPLLKVPVTQQDGSVSSVQLGKLSGVPVVMPQAGGRFVKLPVAAGDVVLLVFADFLLDGWKALGGVQDPRGLAVHGLSNAIAIAGLADPSAAPPSAAIEIKSDGSVLVGAGADASALRGEDVKTWTDLHLHTFVGLPPGVTGTTLQPTVPLPASALSGTVKVK
jgi:hypothetical protein